MGGVGVKSRRKQAAPEPLPFAHGPKSKPKVQGEHTKSDLVHSSKPRSGGKSVSSKRKARLRVQAQAERRPTNLKGKGSLENTSDDVSVAGSDQTAGDDPDESEAEPPGLEEARKAFFSVKDLAEPVQFYSDEDDELITRSESPQSSSSSESGEHGSDSTRTGVPASSYSVHSGGEQSDHGGPARGEGSSSSGSAGQDDRDLDQENVGALSLRKLHTRIQTNAGMLANWRTASTKLTNRSRADIVEQTLDDICHYFGYNRFLAELLWELFGPEQALAFFEANEMARPVTIRANTLRTNRRELAQALINRGVNLEPIGKWSKVGLQVFESGIPIGATPEYLAGHYMLQAASSFLPVIALDPLPGERCLDMSAAPGGKTTFMSAMMKNQGILFANDSSKARCKSLVANATRMGCNNVIVCNHDARDFPRVMGGFDRVLLDAPCSGTGVISKDASVKTNKSERDLLLLSHLQKQLILCAIDSVKTHSSHAGYLVYSTCSVTVEENEGVVDYALKRRPNVKLVETGVSFGEPGFVNFRGRAFHPSLKLARRFYPHVHNVDGFFVAKLKVNPRPKNGKGQANLEMDQHDDAGVAGHAEADLVPVAFDDIEDAGIIAAAKVSQLKAKGLRVTKPQQNHSGDCQAKRSRPPPHEDNNVLGLKSSGKIRADDCIPQSLSTRPAKKMKARE